MERYTVLHKLPNSLYSHDSPVIVLAGALLKDNETNNILAQLKFKNISDKCIKAVSVKVRTFDIAGNELEGIENYQYLDLQAARDDEFGSRAAITLPDRNTRDFRVVCNQVVFSDNSIWNSDGSAMEQLSELADIRTSFSNSELEKQYQIKFGQSAKYLFADHGEIWGCACGAINKSEECSCHKCGLIKAELIGFDKDLLTNDMESRLLKEKEEATVKDTNKRKKTKKIAIISAICTILIISSIFIVSNSAKNAKLNAVRSEVSQYIDSGDYYNAIIMYLKADMTEDAVKVLSNVTSVSNVTEFSIGRGSLVVFYQGMNYTVYKLENKSLVYYCGMGSNTDNNNYDSTWLESFRKGIEKEFTGGLYRVIRNSK